MSRGDPTGASRGGSPTARGKRVPGVEINVRIVQAKAEANGGRKTYLSSKEVPNHLLQSNTFNSIGRFVLNLRTELIEVKGTRLLREKRV
ncbi:hypothetical protein ABKP09_26310 [Peribacillus frigoritolerans]|uniref:hypothetical protein n=1 Tax=Peribacillus frigoritolerans TaxID=450367 RepID=UPI0032B32F2D